MNVTSGKTVHALHTDVGLTLCGTGQNSTGSRRNRKYRETTEVVTCLRCLAILDKNAQPAAPEATQADDATVTDAPKFKVGETVLWRNPVSREYEPMTVTSMRYNTIFGEYVYKLSDGYGSLAGVESKLRRMEVDCDPDAGHALDATQPATQEAAQADTIAELQAENERLQAEVNNWREQVRRQVEAREAIATDKQKTIEAMQQHTDVIRIDLVQAQANETHLQRKVASYVGIMEVLLDLINQGSALDTLREHIEIQQRYGVYGEAD